MVFQLNLLEKSYFIARKSVPAMVRPASSDFLKALLVRICQFLSNLFIMTAKSVNPSFVPCGTPPLTCFHGDRDELMRTAWIRLVKKDRTQEKQSLIDIKGFELI